MGRKRIYESDAARLRAWRARRRKARPAPARPPLGTDAAAVVDWASSHLVVPPGHPLSGQPFVLMDWQVAVIQDVLTQDETCLCISRKNAKSALAAIIILAHLVGPLRRPGWRCGVLSASRSKAGELLMQIEQIAAASSLEGLTVRRVPWPGKLIATDTGSTCEIEGVSHSSGHASGYDLSIVDELGILPERHRPMVAGMRSAVSARGGRFVSLSIRGTSPMLDEILNRKGAPGLAVHHYEGDPDAPLDDEENWRRANPGIDVIKSRHYMATEARRVLETPSDQAMYRSVDLNLPGAPVGELVCSVESWRSCVAAPDEIPPRRGPAYVGIDLGLTQSFTSAAAFWPATNRLEVLTACPSTPALATRARADAAGTLYEVAVSSGALLILDGRLTPIGPFLERLRAHLAGSPVAAVGCDRERSAELLHHLSDQGLAWRPQWRGAGIRAAIDAANDIRAFQRLVESGRLRTPANVLMVSAIGQAHLVRDAEGHAGRLRQTRARGRIDSLQAAVIACGLGEAARMRRARPAGRIHIAG